MSGYGWGSEGGGGGWPGLRQVVCIRTTRQFLRGAQPAVVEDHYYLTSLKPALARGAPEALLGHARRHWEIENGLHHKKDRTMGEDAGRSRRGATALARLRSLAVGLLEHVEGTSTPLKQIALAANPLKALGLLKRIHLPKIRRMDN